MGVDRAEQVKSYEDRLRALADRVAEVGFVARGSVVQSATRCGSPGCHCRADPPVLHGPYWQWSRSVKGKTISRRLTAEEARLYKQWIANGRRLDKLVAQIEDTSTRATELLLPERSRGARSSGA